MTKHPPPFGYQSFHTIMTVRADHKTCISSCTKKKKNMYFFFCKYMLNTIRAVQINIQLCSNNGQQRSYFTRDSEVFSMTSSSNNFSRRFLPQFNADNRNSLPNTQRLGLYLDFLLNKTHFLRKF